MTVSPNGKRGVFSRDWNLWVRDLASRQERQLTRDGEKYFGYATTVIAAHDTAQRDTRKDDRVLSENRSAL